MKLMWISIISWTQVVLSIKSDTEKLQHWESELALCQGVNLKKLTINAAHMLFHRGRLSSAKLTQCYLDRIEAMNPILHAVIETNPDALEIAATLDKKFAATRKLKGILHGIPILIKDNIATKDKMNTTGGNRGLLDNKTNYDARVVELLREAGAIILGKANLSELAGSDNAPLGWSGRGGLTKNPYNLTESASGSSSGSAVAVAANLALAALGSETNGSIIGPSEACGVFGLKPSVYFTSQFGLIPIAPSQDSIGAITKSVNDNFIVTLAISEEPLRHNMQIVYDNNFQIDKNPNNTNMKLYRHKLRELELRLITSTEYTIVDIPRGKFSKDIDHYEKEILEPEFKRHLNLYIHKHAQGNKVQSLQDLLQFNKESIPSYPYDQQALATANTAPKLSSSDLQEKLAAIQTQTRKKINLILDKNKLDMILVPSATNLRGFSPPDVAGYPIINIPIGIRSENSVPIGISLYGLPKSEPNLLYMARVIEHLMPRSSPNFEM